MTLPQTEMHAAQNCIADVLRFRPCTVHGEQLSSYSSDAGLHVLLISQENGPNFTGMKLACCIGEISGRREESLLSSSPHLKKSKFFSLECCKRSSKMIDK